MPNTGTQGVALWIATPCHASSFFKLGAEPFALLPSLPIPEVSAVPIGHGPTNYRDPRCSRDPPDEPRDRGELPDEPRDRGAPRMNHGPAGSSPMNHGPGGLGQPESDVMPSRTRAAALIAVDRVTEVVSPSGRSATTCSPFGRSSTLTDSIPAALQSSGPAPSIQERSSIHGRGGLLSEPES